MPVFLHINTATENAIIGISENETVIDFLTNNNQKDHASFVQEAIKNLLQRTGISIKKLDAVSVTQGPGSYTGLRVGMASAKGLCYVLKIPLLTLNTLEIMALSVIEKNAEPERFLYCPMIDARRLEVFTALFDHKLNEVLPASSVIIEPGYLDDIIQKRSIILCGNGAKKFIDLSPHGNLTFDETKISISALAKSSSIKFSNKQFSNLFTTDAAYLKPFFSSQESKSR